MTFSSDPQTPPQPPKCNAEERGCVAAAAYIISSKWTPQLIYVLASGVRRFGAIQKEVGGVNPRTLSARLDDLEEEGIVTKAQFNEVPPRVEYALTQKGTDLIPVLECMADWGGKYR